MPLSKPAANSLRIVRAAAKDAERIAALFDAYRQFYKQKPDLAGARAFIGERLKRDESVIFLALAGAEAVGFVQLYPCFSSTAMKRMWILNDLFVAPDARRHGAGKVLMERARQWAVETKADGLWLETAVDNHPGQRLYESLGWKRDNDFYRYLMPL
ncbi:MAG TPA: GNAT family N-acetyltransferase [Terriglobales bacterium]|nr:GNAT family N-acetyltransferase [Terriglobales bacterium]